MTWVLLVFGTVGAMASSDVGAGNTGLDGTELPGVVVMDAVPRARNVLLFPSPFRTPPGAVRDMILLSSLLSFPAILLASMRVP